MMNRLILYDREYDGKKWAEMHPGGPEVIESLMRLEPEVQQRLFEISHRNPKLNLKRLEAYAITEKKVIPEENDKFYDYVRDQVYTYLSRQYPKNPRGHGQVYGKCKCLAAFVVWSAFLVCAATRKSIFGIFGFSFLAGVQLMVWGLNQFHDSSHFAFSGGYKVNRNLTAAWAACAYWPAWLWHAHHVEAHHANTGDYDRDPDLRHGQPFMRKTPVAPRRRYLDLSVALQFFSMAIVPGMFFGSFLQYSLVRFGLRKSLWKMQALEAPPSHRMTFWEKYILSLWFPIWLITCSMHHSFCIALLASFIYLIGVNITYAANILPDHDTCASHANLAKLLDQKDKPSWAATQVAASANFAGPFWGFFFGGLNFQIEHHLFPRIHHSFYPEIAPIVKAACSKFDLPYVHYPSFFAAAAAVYQQIASANSDIYQQ